MNSDLTKKEIILIHRNNFKLGLDDNIPLGLIIRFTHAKRVIKKYKRNYNLLYNHKINTPKYVTFNV